MRPKTVLLQFFLGVLLGSTSLVQAEVQFVEVPPGTFKRLDEMPVPISPGKSSAMSPWKYCDANFDGKCDTTDLTVVRANLGKCGGTTGLSFVASSLDSDGDGCITLVDYAFWLQAYRSGQ